MPRLARQTAAQCRRTIRPRVARAGALAAPAVVLGCLAGLATPAVAQQSTFDADTEGWMTVELPAPPYDTVVAEYPVVYRPMDGNPGGAIQQQDFNGNLFMFAAPAAFLGDQSDRYGATLRFDMQFLEDGLDPGTVHPDVVLFGAGLTLVVDGWVDPPVQTGLWETYAVALDDTADWRLSSLTGPVATEQQIRDVLGDLTRILIRADYWAGAEVTRLDNVQLGDLVGDLDGDGQVGFTDLLQILSAWGPCAPPPAPCPGDLDGDGNVGFGDLLVLLSGWTG